MATNYTNNLINIIHLVGPDEFASDGADCQVDPEYVRGAVEMLMDSSSLHADTDHYSLKEALITVLTAGVPINN